MNSPRLSLVAALRNEQYGGDLFARTRAFVRNVGWNAERAGVDVEVILVEWCPLDDAPSLAEIVEPTHVPVRVVTVGRDVAARRFDGADEIALWIYAAKNVGIRRARAPFVLATNPDVLYTPSLFREITDGKLDPGRFYRTSRYDVADVPLDLEPGRQLDRAERSIVRVNLIGNSIRFDVPSGGRDVAKAVKRYNTLQTATAPDGPEAQIERPTDWLHTNASGDFFLLHRDRWEDLHGYPELASAGHLDSYICVMAASAGIAQVVIDGRKRLYHLEHPRAIEWDRPGTGGPYHIPFEQFLAEAQAMLREGRPTRFNDGRWGLGDLDLPETTVGRDLGYRR